mmetsp:Transcript_29396/g.77019  ORF Transcript_29396/g.77019 Transcript_29396/m.77019 type:complete len:262 (+) Transcript_29396:177-962(+)
MGMFTMADITGTLEVRLQRNSRTQSVPPFSLTQVTGTSTRYTCWGTRIGRWKQGLGTRYRFWLVVHISATSRTAWTPAFCARTTTLNSGPMPATCALSLTWYPPPEAIGPWPAPSRLTYARAVESRSLHRSRWKVRCMSTACSRSRVVCSTYSLVFLGTSSGMSCSGGGPGGAPLASRLALRVRILTMSAPLLKLRTMEPSSRPKVPSLIPVTTSFVCVVETSCLPLYSRTSPLFSATATTLAVRIFVMERRLMHEMGAGR